MSAHFEDRLGDIAVWWQANKEVLPPHGEALIKRMKFLEKTLDCMFELLGIMAEDLRDAEGRLREEKHPLAQYMRPDAADSRRKLLDGRPD